MRTAITIGERFCGPPGTANGGYTSGLLASLMDAPTAEVTLHRPVPLGRALAVEMSAEGHVSLYDVEGVIALTKPQPNFELTLPQVPTFEEAVRAMSGFPALLDTASKSASCAARTVIWATDFEFPRPS